MKNNKKYTINEIENYIQSKYPKSILLTKEYINCDSKLELVCEKKHKFKISFYCIKHRNQWCRKCGRDQSKITCLEKYGVDNPSKNSDIKKKIINTNNIKYNGNSPSCDKEIYSKIRKTNIIKYGGVSPVHSKEIKGKIEKTNLGKYGVKNPAQCLEVKKKNKETNLKKYGFENPMQNKEIRQKSILTCLKNYNSDNPMKNKEVASRSSRNMIKSIVRYHWKTGDELICQSSWEVKVVDYLNNNKVEYNWQSTIFELSTGKTYRPDLYLIQNDTWVEIKGFFRGDATEKWEEFHNILMRNSELWNKEKLNKMGIL